MNWMAQHWLALALLAGYTSMLLYNAYLGSQASRGVAGYYVGNREMSGVVVGISFFATFASTNTYIGLQYTRACWSPMWVWLGGGRSTTTQAQRLGCG